MHETAEDLSTLQDLLDRSYAAGGTHLRSVITAERRLTALRGAALLKSRQFQRGLPAYFASFGAVGRMSILRSAPGVLIWLFWFLVAIVLILLVALLIHHFGGFSLSFHVGYFHFFLGVT